MNLNTSAQFVDMTFAFTGDPKTNSRALRQLNLLSDLGLNILVLGLGDSADNSHLDIQNVTLRYLHRPTGKGPRFFWHVHQLFESAARDIKSTIYHASDLYSLPAMHRAARLHQAKLVFDARELYTHVPATIRRPWVRMIWSTLQHLYLRHTNCIYSVSESIAQHLKKYYRLPAVHVVHNVPGPQRMTPSISLKQRLNLPSNMKIILHQGNLQKYRGGPMMVEAMRYTENATLVFMGKGPLRTEIEQLVKTLNLASKVQFTDPVPPDQLLSVTASADIGLTFLEDCCLNHKYALPNKLFEYLAAGVPVIASDLPEIAQVIHQFDVGCVVPSGDVQALGTALDHAIKNTELRQKWASNTSRVQEFFNFETESKRFLDPYQLLLDK
ncbi:MAG: glycosyltransferase [Bacteroidetes bacterium]|nr:glycosyltransferase [Bacteroidota bacterium]MCY4205770.1 glycosyltransferase [Bacteroidota bacterium]